MQNTLRPLKYHEQKLLKKVDFLNWETDGNQEFRKRVLDAVTKYKLRDQEEYYKYLRIVKEVNNAIKEINALVGPEYDDFKIQQKSILLAKLIQMGIVGSHQKELPKGVAVEAICARRLSYLMYKQHFTESVLLAKKYISQGHVRIGPEIVTDPAYLVTRNLEDFVTWTDQGKIRKTILKFNEEADDYNELNC